ncbi:MAG: IS110 family transposase [Actinomycetota bacterium]|nr:IS110 family transposase [Actinomycetota bacterium]
MPSLALARTDVIVGVDTHKDTHVAVALDGLGGRLDGLTIPATNDGYAALIAWASALGPVHLYAVEGCGSYGIGLARFLRRHGHPPVEVSRPPRAGARRMSGKSDAIDAEHAARTALSGEGTVTPKLADGQVEAIRLVKIVRDAAVKARTTVMVTLKAVLVTATDDLREGIEPLTDHKLVLACAALEGTGAIADPEVAMAHTLGSLARRWLDLHEEVKVHTGHLKTLTRQAAPAMLDAFGVGVDIAAQMLITAGDNADRVHSEAAFAKLCGVCPIPTGSGRTDGTYRLNRGGNRQANAALYRAVIVRMRWHPPTIAYVERRTAEGKSKKAIIRCLKRYLLRELYQLLPDTSSNPATLDAA